MMQRERKQQKLEEVRGYVRYLGLLGKHTIGTIRICSVARDAQICKSKIKAKIPFLNIIQYLLVLFLIGGLRVTLCLSASKALEDGRNHGQGATMVVGILKSQVLCVMNKQSEKIKKNRCMIIGWKPKKTERDFVQGGWNNLA